MAEAGASVPLIAKIERPAAVENLPAILNVAQGVMVARGDLGLEMPLEQLPRVQKQIVRSARALGRPVILATQVLESMRVDPRPTRAEVSDAANAVDEGADAIMLAGETAAGAYPVRAVQTLDAIIRDAESLPPAERSVLAVDPTGSRARTRALRGGADPRLGRRGRRDRRGHARGQDRAPAVGAAAPGADLRGHRERARRRDPRALLGDRHHRHGGARHRTARSDAPPARDSAGRVGRRVRQRQRRRDSLRRQFRQRPENRMRTAAGRP